MTTLSCRKIHLQRSNGLLGLAGRAGPLLGQLRGLVKPGGMNSKHIIARNILETSALLIVLIFKLAQLSQDCLLQSIKWIAIFE